MWWSHALPPLRSGAGSSQTSWMLSSRFSPCVKFWSIILHHPSWPSSSSIAHPSTFLTQYGYLCTTLAYPPPVKFHGTGVLLSAVKDPACSNNWHNWKQRRPKQPVLESDKYHDALISMFYIEWSRRLTQGWKLFRNQGWILRSSDPLCQTIP